MGCWGYYDDESDNCCMAWDKLLAKFKEKLQWADDLDYEDYEQKFIEAIKSDNALYNDILDFLRSTSSSSAIGIGLTLIRSLSEKPIQCQPLYALPPPSDIGITLPDSFPQQLSEYIVECIEGEIEMIDNGGGGGWKCTIDRQKALNHELYIFSRGRLGSNTIKIKNSFEKMFTQ